MPTIITHHIANISAKSRALHGCSTPISMPGIAAVYHQASAVAAASAERIAMRSARVSGSRRPGSRRSRRMSASDLSQAAVSRSYNARATAPEDAMERTAASPLRAAARCASTILALAACTSPPPPEPGELTVGAVQREIKVGTPQASVAEALGAPSRVSTDSQGREVWTY